MTVEVQESKRGKKEILGEAFSYFTMALGKETLSCVLYRNPGSNEFSLFNSQWSFREFTAEPARRTIVNESSRGPRSILILDAQTDSRLKGVQKPKGLKSALCVPVVGKQGVLGFLYSETTVPNKLFSQTQVDEFDKYVKSIVPQWEEMFARDSGGTSSESLVQWLAVSGLAFLIIFAFGAFRVSQDIEPPPPPAEVVNPAEAEVETVVSSFLTALKVRQFDSAHYFLATSLQEKYKPEALEKVLTEWLDQDEHGWDVKYREPGMVREKVGQAEVTVRSNAPDKKRKPWTWSLVKQSDGWKLFKFQGGPPVNRRG